jgi:hypothetical protein
VARTSSGGAARGAMAPTQEANAKAEAECPDGNDREDGIGTIRDCGTPAATRSGRGRGCRDLTPRLTAADVTPIAAIPRSAARRPSGPPKPAMPAAIASQMPE